MLQCIVEINFRKHLVHFLMSRLLILGFKNNSVVFFVEAVTGCAHKRLSLAPMSTLGRQAGSLAKLAH